VAVDTIIAVRTNGCVATYLSLYDGDGSLRQRNEGGAKGSQRGGRGRGRDVTGGQQHAGRDLMKLVSVVSHHVTRCYETEAQQSVVDYTQTRRPARR
jgi:hypothetical protein